MATRNNSAARVARLFQKIPGVGNQGTSVQGWARVFDLPNSDSSQAEREIAQLLGLAQLEIEKVRRLLQNEEKDPQSYEAILNRAERLLSVQLLAAAWSQVQQQLGPEVTASFWLLAEFLADEEPVVEEADLRALLDEVTVWEARVNESDLPAPVKRLLLDQIAFIRRAARQYPLRGSAAFASAAIDAAVDWERHSSTLREYEGRPEVRGVRDLWPAVEKYSKRVILIGGAAAAILAPVQQILGIVHPPKALPAGPAIELHVAPPGMGGAPSEPKSSSDNTSEHPAQSA